MLFSIQLFFALLSLLKCTRCAGINSIRATWVPVSYDQNDEATVRGLLNSLKDIGVNRVYVDVWNQGTVYFNSPTMNALLPDGTGVGDDHLKWTLSAASDVGIEVYAWFEYGLIAAYGGINNGFSKVATDKGWILGQEGQGFVWMDPDNQDVLAFLSGIMGDAWTGYSSLGLKGVQLDDHFASPVSLGKNFTSMNNAMEYVREYLQTQKDSQGNVPILSLSPSTLSQAMQSYNVDWNLWGDQNLYDEVIPQLYRSDYQSFKSVFDQTMKQISGVTMSYFTSSGIRVDGSGDVTPWDDVNQSIEYAASFGVSPCIWYAHGIVEVYPEQFTQLWDQA